MAEILLALVIAFLLTERVFSQRSHDAMTRRLLNEARAATVPELIALTRNDDPTPAPQGSKELIHPIGA